ncbi:MAG: hypothetical protein SFU91_13860 [Chloroherpetonaceae bacterium]|nr:hypothetical protein [Chloroherpetonaceae bacterium]
MKPLFVRLVSLSLLAAINSLFIYKYSARLTSLFLPISLLSFVLFIGFYWWLLNRTVKQDALKSYLMLALIALMSIPLLILNPVLELKVDRWMMIQTFWDNFFSGSYPYAPRYTFYNQNVPAPLPYYFLFTFPFYLVREISLVTLFTLLLVVFLYQRATDRKIHLNRDIKPQAYFHATMFLLFLIVMPAFWWEVTTRSALLFNSLLILTFICYWLNDALLLQRGSLWIYAVGFGMLCGTRSVMALPLFICLVYAVRESGQVRIYAGFLFVAAIVFILPFALLYAFDPILFFQYNPLISQSLVLPYQWSVWLIIFCFFLLIFTTSFDRVIFFSGLILFAGAFLSLGYFSSQSGWNAAVFGSLCDISYFILSIPFFIASIYRELDKRESRSLLSQ